MYIAAKNKINLFGLIANQASEAHQMLTFLPVSIARTNKLYFFQQCTLYVCKYFIGLCTSVFYLYLSL